MSSGLVGGCIQCPVCWLVVIYNIQYVGCWLYTISSVLVSGCTQFPVCWLEVVYNIQCVGQW